MTLDTERSPLTGLDELPIHQNPEPLRIVGTSDPRAYERYWFTAQDPASDVYLVTGFGFYPNMGTADAYAILVRDNKHTTVRAYRVLGDDRSVISTGPLNALPVEPFKEWHLTLADNAQGLTFDLRWRDTKRAVFQRFGGGGMESSKDGRPALATAGYESFGNVEGTVTIGGRTVALTPETTIGSRDHHWGTREGVGGPNHMVGTHQRRSHLGQWVEFRDWSLWGMRCLWNIGDDTHPRATPVVPLSNRMRFDPETHHLLGGIVSNRFPDSSVKEIHYESIGNRVAYLRCGMYTGPDQTGTPEENYFHGSLEGAEGVGGETYDLTDPKVRVRIAGFEDHLVRATCDGEATVGILECSNPVLYEMCRDKVPGFSLLE
jgi:hypothetical protein